VSPREQTPSCEQKLQEEATRRRRRGCKKPQLVSGALDTHKQSVENTHTHRRTGKQQKKKQNRKKQSKKKQSEKYQSGRDSRWEPAGRARKFEWRQEVLLVCVGTFWELQATRGRASATGRCSGELLLARESLRVEMPSDRLGLPSSGSCWRQAEQEFQVGAATCKREAAISTSLKMSQEASGRKWREGEQVASSWRESERGEREGRGASGKVAGSGAGRARAALLRVSLLMLVASQWERASCGQQVMRQEGANGELAVTNLRAKESWREASSPERLHRVAALATKLDHWLRCNRLNLLFGQSPARREERAATSKRLRAAYASASAADEPETEEAEGHQRGFCRAHFDGHLCWPQANAGEQVQLPCPVLSYLAPAVLQADNQSPQEAPRQPDTQAAAAQSTSGALEGAQVQVGAPSAVQLQPQTVATDSLKPPRTSPQRTNQQQIQQQIQQQLQPQIQRPPTRLTGSASALEPENGPQSGPVANLSPFQAEQTDTAPSAHKTSGQADDLRHFAQSETLEFVSKLKSQTSGSAGE